ncbi:sugar phosphate isomerase/epimerase [Brachybacterium sp. GPGPB12]|uniref:sugar phosphate isomerase/epimerase family protein n=1 Tax=Brachybacterium sp. GPGPB12 TaxID=3023517 RepID=UPI00313433A3
MELTGLTVSGNPLSPLPTEGLPHAHDLRRTIELAGGLGVRDVVAMSGTPGTDPGARYPAWIVNPWNGIDLEILEHQWSVAVPFWKEIDALARERDVRLAFEMHPRNLVFSPLTFEQFLDRVEPTNIGVNLDPSHLFWQADGADRLHRAARRAHHPRARQGHRGVARRDRARRARHRLRPGARGPRPAHPHRHRPLLKHLAGGPGLALRGPRRGARRGLLDPVPHGARRGEPEPQRQHRARGRGLRQGRGPRARRPHPPRRRRGRRGLSPAAAPSIP